MPSPIPAIEDLTITGVSPLDKLNPGETLADFKAPTESVKPRRSRSDKGTTRTNVAKRASLETRIAQQLMSINMIILLLPIGDMEKRQKDALSVEEIKALAHALNSQAQASNTFKKLIEGALAVSSSGELITVMAMIVARRAINHNLIPEQYSGLVEMMVLTDAEESTVEIEV
jgi:hypothetical protein